MLRRVGLFLVLACLIAVGGFGLKQWKAHAPVPSGSLVAWARQHAIPIKTVEAGSGFDDLRPLKAVVGQARVVGMGEATHGTREFFQFKHRTFEFLVQEMGFTAIAFETSFPLATKLNAYVLGGSGSGNGRDLVRRIGLWAWNTEEVVALVEWMRDYNLKPTTARKVRFYGFDMQGMAPALHEALSYLKEVDPGLARTFVPFAVRAGDLQPGVHVDAQKLAEAKAGLARLLHGLETNRARYSQTADEREWRYAVQNTRVAMQAIALLQNYKDAVRDHAMTQNVRWILHEEGEAGRIMLWAHNAHISHPPEMLGGWVPADMARGFTPMGTRLRKALGPDYLAFGFSFNQGGFRAQPVKSDSVGPASADSLDGVLARVGPPLFVLDVRGQPDDPDAAKWLKAAHSARSISLYGGRDDQNEIVVQDCFDAVVFFDRTTASRRQTTPR